MPEGMLAFAALSAVVAVTPGPDSLLVVQHTLRRGRREGVRVAAGAGAGSLAWGIGSALGLTAMLAASAQLYRGVQLAGAGYLVYWRRRPRRRHLTSPMRLVTCSGRKVVGSNPTSGSKMAGQGRYTVAGHLPCLPR
jgi:LysE type translocator